MYNFSENRKREFIADLLTDYFKKYEAPMYASKHINQAEIKFVTHYMIKPDWDLQYNKLLNYQYQNERRRMEERQVSNGLEVRL